jgi:SPP1 family predicted phage head-tail adaptor
MARVDEGRPLNPGILRHQIVWQKKVVSGQDSYGQDVVDWAQFVLVKAQIKSLTGRELQDAQQRWGDAQYQITQHYVRNLERGMRGVWLADGRTKYLDILDIRDEPGTGSYQRIIARNWTA